MKTRHEFPSQEYAILKGLEPFLNYKKSARYPIGIGDDAAVRTSRVAETLVFTADTMVEDVHFSLEYMTLRDMGFKAMCVNLSDCAAMGSRPDAALAQIVFPHRLTSRELRAAMKALYAGFHKACVRWKYPIVGGNLSKGPCWIIDITLIGSMQKGVKPIMRTGARPGDGLWVTGVPGSSAAGLAVLKASGAAAGRNKAFAQMIKAHIAPTPRLELGRLLARSSHVHAMIDVSDGIAKECRTLAYDNAIGIIIEERCLVFPRQMRALGKRLGCDCIEWFLYGGEDYELLFIASPTFDPAPVAKACAVSLTKIGLITNRAKGVFFKRNNGTMMNVDGNGGWDHIGK